MGEGAAGEEEAWVADGEGVEVLGVCAVGPEGFVDDEREVEVEGGDEATAVVELVGEEVVEGGGEDFGCGGDEVEVEEGVEVGAGGGELEGEGAVVGHLAYGVVSEAFTAERGYCVVVGVAGQFCG